MTPPIPALRCLSCGYDIASLVETRGRDDPGVCPECGTDARNAVRLSRRPGTPWQRRPFSPVQLIVHNLRSILEPSAVARETRFPRINQTSASFWNCLTAAYLTLVLPSLAALVFQGPGVFLIILIYAAIGAIPLFGAYLFGMLFVNAFAQLEAKRRGWVINDLIAEAAVDIGSGWLGAFPFVAWGCVGLILAIDTNATPAATVAFILIGAAMWFGALVATILALDELRAMLSIPVYDRTASKRPAPSNLT